MYNCEKCSAAVCLNGLLSKNQQYKKENARCGETSEDYVRCVSGRPQKPKALKCPSSAKLLFIHLSLAHN